MIRYSEKYVELVAAGLEPGRYINIAAGEWFSGLPTGWTNPKPGSVDATSVQSLLPPAGAEAAPAFLQQ